MSARRAFSLLEVMVAIAILGLTLTVILSAQGGLAASNRSAANMGMAAQLARCKMTELEEHLLKMGYPELDMIETDVACCVDEPTEPFVCDTRVEKIELPNLPAGGGAGEAGLDLSSPSGASSTMTGLGAIANNPAGSGALDLEAGLQGLGTSLQGQMGGQGMAGMLSMVLGFVYPATKPMMEASIRRVTVTVRWKEGPNQRDLPLTQYVTNPARGGMLGGVLGVDGGAPLAPGPTPGGSAGVPGAATPGTPGVPGVTR